jgi:hypothetical protein
MAACSLVRKMLISYANIMLDVFIKLIKIQYFSSYICQYITLSSGLSTEGAHEPNNKNDKSQKRDDAFLIWLDALPKLSIRQFLIGA